ncbi:PBSX family phage terminase large subunit [Lactobacillus hamsteri]|uniref:Phage terminase large subunit B n=1 Tax=Lactobacillus hamsteri DSM 5661 = JCM 6256 TaxID=1423754 RepID=A0A0R1Y8S3_9LACO|nr:PBSX family phage terminase large subunit [Lactobacillus hamsteri]KRM37012.1 phage terminase large subunit B [Lactobacillus hamsteri DSM 5661 = JCM 6256]
MALTDVLTPKQAKVLNTYLTKPFKIMILTGAVRSGKTHIDNYLFLYELRRVAKLAKELGDNHPQFILAGASSGSIYNNVIAEISRQFGIDLRPDKHNHYHLFGVDVVPVYTGSIAGLAGARGFTSYGAYINEATLANQEVFNEIRNRCSMEDSHIICDTNPDIPTHWLKTDFIDNKDPEAGIVSYTFTIDDNTFLDPGYVKSLKASTPKGMFYDRAIRGQWVTGDGIVYQDFNQDTMVIDDDKIPTGLHYFVGVDWGFEHPNPIILMGEDDDGNTYILKDFTKKHKFIKYWVNIAKNLQNEYGRNLVFYCDSARPDNLNEFQSNGINALNANKNVLPGIEYVSSLMAQGRFFIAKSCSKGVMEEIYQYAWDEKTGEPLKENETRHNDRLDAIRYGIYSRNAKGGYIPWN